VARELLEGAVDRSRAWDGGGWHGVRIMHVRVYNRH
jgi:hypothetical protein